MSRITRSHIGLKPWYKRDTCNRYNAMNKMTTYAENPTAPSYITDVPSARVLPAVDELWIFMWIYQAHLTLILNATLQTSHTLTQLHASLLATLSTEGSCVSSSSSELIESCDQLTCNEDNQQELTLACNIEHRVLPEIDNLVFLLRRKVSRFS